MLQTGTTTIGRADAAIAVTSHVAGRDRCVEQFSQRPYHLEADRRVDEVLADSFPASDPPSWNTGAARPQPIDHLEHQAAIDQRIAAARQVENTLTDAPSDATSAGDVTFIQGLASLAGAVGIVLLLPLAILLLGLPIALGVRGLIETVAWLFGVTVQ